jgi:hypothetical protein
MLEDFTDFESKNRYAVQLPGGQPVFYGCAGPSARDPPLEQFKITEARHSFSCLVSACDGGYSMVSDELSIQLESDLEG